ncbi:hypothetical protein Pcinc_001735 [Petrolisthes cinctipes]|uniref:Uncharacterized protein n=1 Tax=Petrolisthes cinctipes TaxID=88211 RepID=A0AAE1GK37_PETCI|nr:hypothetical protein Pcinc_001735 [Petrolisthes cinctipes]
MINSRKHHQTSYRIKSTEFGIRRQHKSWRRKISSSNFKVKQQGRQTRGMVLQVSQYIRMRSPLMCEADLEAETVAATGVSIRTLQRIKKEVKEGTTTSGGKDKKREKKGMLTKMRRRKLEKEREKEVVEDKKKKRKVGKDKK